MGAGWWGRGPATVDGQRERLQTPLRGHSSGIQQCGERISVYRTGRHTPGLQIIEGAGRQASLMGIFQASSSYVPKQVIKAGQVSPKGRLDSGDTQSAPLLSCAELGEGA